MTDGGQKLYHYTQKVYENGRYIGSRIVTTEPEDPNYWIFILIFALSFIAFLLMIKFDII